MIASLTQIQLGLLLSMATATTKPSMIENRNNKMMSCDSSKTTNPMTIPPPEIPHEIVTIREIPITIEEFPKKIRAIIAFRFRYTSYCYTGFSGSSDCKTNVTSVFPDISEVKKWVNLNKCLVGPYCNPLLDCSGTKANQICLDNEPVMKETGREEFMHKSFPIPVQLYHTCVQDWKCGFKSTEMPIHLSSDQSKQQPLISDQNGNDIVLDTQVLQDGFTMHTEYIIHFPQPNITPKILQSKAKCSSSSPMNILCSFSSPTNSKRVIIEMNPTSFLGVHRNLRVRIDQPIETIINGSVQMIEKGNKQTHSPTDTEKSSSIEDVIEVINTMKAIQLQSIYNSWVLQKEIHNIKSVINQIVKRTSKIDDELLCNIMGMSCKTKWINDNYFHLYKCDYQWKPSDTNCYGNLIYKNGEFVHNINKDLCFPIDPDKTQPLEYWEENKLNDDIYQMEEPEPSSIQWDGWTWMLDNSIKTRDMFIHSFSEGFFKFNIEKIFPWQMSTIYHAFISLSSIIGWVSLLLVLCKK